MEWARVKNITQALNVIKKALPNSKLLLALMILVDLDSYHEAASDGPTRMTVIIAKHKTKFTELFNTDLYPTMKSCNDDILESVKR